ncbi:MAG: hypothetical protein WAP51_01670 [Candidatus Sungiibacteriota bacterium]
MENVLQQMVGEGLLDSFIYYDPNSREDMSGRDFAVVRGGVTRDVGVTTSYKHWKECYARYSPAVSILHIPFNSSDSEIAEKFLALFDSSGV